MICCHYIQKGCLFKKPSFPSHILIRLLTNSLSRTLSIFPPLAGRFVTDSDGYIFITSNDAGVDFIHATATELSVADLLSAIDVPHYFKELFPYHWKISYDAHFSSIMAVQVTELADGVFIDFRRENILVSNAVLQLPEDEIKVTFNYEEPLRERIFSFSYDSIQKLKARVNQRLLTENDNGHCFFEILSFQSLCALVWRAVTRARKLPETKTTTFRMAVNIRNRIEPKLSDSYFGNAIQGIATRAVAGDMLLKDMRWCAEQLNNNVKAHDSTMVRRELEDWERDPKCFALRNRDGATIQMGSLPRFSMYENDFGWGKPVAVRSGGGNKFDGKMSAFTGREGSGAVDLEVILAPETMVGIENDPEFMFYVSS
ncbi:hypothetical protein TanjilG_23814 [Lupinus angustifolius]|uniref:Uncharacterized protein n=1 Tax=Lupinus angustifolius TaxID=3871 RepID=A0A4P1QV42_LUPAN|nr:hypothetical protein TanjilG_23814 [Lupinus angustifolius]